MAVHLIRFPCPSVRMFLNVLMSVTRLMMVRSKRFPHPCTNHLLLTSGSRPLFPAADFLISSTQHRADPLNRPL